VEEFRRRLIPPCTDLSGLVREVLESVDEVSVVDARPVLLASNPPKLRVSYVVALTSGRLAYDEMVVVVPLAARVLPAAGAEAMDGQGRRCGDVAPGG
jgi:hypothetical protein